MKYKCPLIEIVCQNQIMSAVIDTGSEVDCIAEEVFGKLNQSRISMLPVSNIKLISAFGGKSYTIKKQIMIKIKCDTQEINSTLLVVRKLNFDFIFGTKWCAENKVDIKYSNNTMINNHIIKDPIVTFNSKTINKIPNDKNKIKSK